MGSSSEPQRQTSPGAEPKPCDDRGGGRPRWPATGQQAAVHHDAEEWLHGAGRRGADAVSPGHRGTQITSPARMARMARFKDVGTVQGGV